MKNAAKSGLVNISLLTRPLSLSKNSPRASFFNIISGSESGMEKWRKDNRKEVVMTDIEGIVPKDHLLRKIEKVTPSF